MKKLLLFLIFMSIVQHSMAQTENSDVQTQKSSVQSSAAETQQSQIDESVFELNMGIPKNTNGRNRNVSSNQLLSIKLINTNPYKYWYQINATPVNFFKGDVADVFNELIVKFKSTEEGTDAIQKEREDMLTNNIELLRKEKSISEADLAEFQKNAEEFLNIQKQKLEKIRAFKISETILNNEKSEKSEDEVEMLEDDPLISRGNELKEECINILNSYDDTTLRKSRSKRQELKERLKRYEAAIKIYKDAIESKNETQKKNILNTQLVEIQKMENLRSEISSYILSISAEDHLDEAAFLKKREKLKGKFGDLITSINKLSLEASNFDDTLKEYNERLEELKKITASVKTELNKMFAVKFDNYQSIDIDGKNIDVVRVIVKRYNRLDNTQKPYEYSPYNIWVKGGFKFDIGGSLFLTSLVDREYFTTNTVINEDGTDQTYQLIHEKNTGDYTLGFGTTLNISYRTGGWIRPTLSIGTLLNQDQKFQIIAGGGFVIGKEARIVLHAGLAMGSVTTISDRYRADGTTPYTISGDDAIPTVEKFSFGHFFGITYNFGKPKAAEKE